MGTGGWQPIDTAPRDGTRVMLCDPDGDAHIARWLLKANPPELMIVGDPEYGGWVIWHKEGEADAIVVPEATHWMPLPEPPSDVESRPARMMEGGASEQSGRAVTGQDRTHDERGL